MFASRIPLPTIMKAIRDVCFALEENSHRPFSWTNMTEEDLWRELVACILGSRVRYEVAHSAVERMDRLHLFSEDRRSSCFQRYERDAIKALCTRGASDESCCYPFFKARANQIRRTAEQFYGRSDTLSSFLERSCDTRDARRRLVSEVLGLGPKQASLFLRNIGYAMHIAVLDSHVLTYMRWVGLTKRLIKTVPTLQKYETLENTFIDHAYSLGYTPDRFDLAVWVVVKVAKEELKIWA